MSDKRARAALPVAANLIAAVASKDAARIERLLANCPDLYALAVVLADQAVIPKSMPTGAPCMFNEDERRSAHARYWRGERDAQTVLGEREYQRERRRQQRIQAPSPDVLDERGWVTRPGGVRVYVDDQLEAS
jgi:hypothetical protein